MESSRTMRSFQFSIRVYIKGTRITPFIMPREGMYKCNWIPTGICNFEGINDGYLELYRRLDEYFHMDEKLIEEESLIEYYDRTKEDLRKIGSQEEFERALRHSSETYSPFSLVIKVNAKRRDEHWYNGESVSTKETLPFSTTWRVSKPKFTCIREWLLNLEQNGQVCENVLSDCSYSEKAFLYAQFCQQGSQAVTNKQELNQKMDQSNLPNNPLTSIKASPTSTTIHLHLHLLEPENENQKMLHEKMMMDPVISLVLFNEYIPLRAPPPRSTSSASAVCEKMSGLFLGSSEGEAKVKDKEVIKDFINENNNESIFIRSELPPPAEENKPTTSGGIFIRSVEEETTVNTDDWVIA